ncbi:M64 family metallopeptidase [Gammaproteobacteria bacterium]|nr:M64 family metallopeptidase [Gammaproteobacteria bacterium]
MDTSEYSWDSESEILVVSVSHEGRSVWQLELDEIAKIRAEIFDPSTGEIIQNANRVNSEIRNQYKISIPTEFIEDDIAIEIIEENGARRLIEMLPISRLIDFSEFIVGDDAARNDDLFLNSALKVMSESGDYKNRVNILFLGDGFTDTELNEFRNAADNAMNGFLSEPPYDAYREYFNVYRIDIASNESGVSHPENGIQRDTAFGSYYNCGDIQRLICADYSKVMSVVESNFGASDADIIIVLVNDAEYGGSGGGFAVASMHSAAIDLVLHETGHSFGRLADEYDSPLPSTPSSCSERDTSEPNVSKMVESDEIKWKHWFDSPITIPTPNSDNSVPGFYAGSKYCSSLYRPTPNSKMRSLGRPFDAINEEALILKINGAVDLIEFETPNVVSNPHIEASFSMPVTFSVQTLKPASHDLRVDWFDGEVWLGSGDSLSSLLLKDGDHEVHVIVSDPSEKIRKDENFIAVSRRTWIVSNSVPVNSFPYFLELENKSYNEGDAVRLSLVTIGLEEGTLIPYFISGVSDSDIQNMPLEGELVVDGTGLTVIEVSLSLDQLTEGQEELVLTLSEFENKKKSIFIKDFSKDPVIEEIAHTTSILVDAGIVSDMPMILNGLREEIILQDGVPVSHIFYHNGKAYEYGSISSFIMVFLRDGEFSAEFIEELSMVAPSLKSITYNEAVKTVGLSNIDNAIITVAGSDGDYIN